MARTTIPGSLGLPYVGETIALFSDPLTFVAKRRQRYGMVFKTRVLGGSTAVVLPGADAQHLVLVSGGAHSPFRAGMGYRTLEPFLGTSLLQLDGMPHQVQRKLVTPAFQAHNYAEYLARINRAFDAVVADWPQHGQRRFYDDAHTIALRVSTALVVGVEHGLDQGGEGQPGDGGSNGERTDRRERAGGPDTGDVRDLDRLLNTVFAGAADPLHLDLPFTRFRRALAAKSQLDARLRTLVARRRAAPAGDVLSLLLAARDEEGNPLSEEQLLAHLRLLLFAGYDTTTAALSWGLIELLRHPALYERVRREVQADDVGGEVPVTVQDLRGMPYLDAVIKETLRLHPASSVLVRGVHEPFTFAGHTIPAGWIVVLPLAYTHRMAEYFDEPERFDPERFLAPREEDRRTPYAWMGFGGGAHLCVGMGVGQIEIKTVFARLLRQFDFTLVPGQDTSTVFVPVNRPRGGALVAFTRKAVSPVARAGPH
jgi:retinoid hydroxylase